MSRVVIKLFIGIAVVVAASGEGQCANRVPVRGKGQGIFYPNPNRTGGRFVASGPISHLGMTQGRGSLVLSNQKLLPGGRVQFDFKSDQTLQAIAAANKDEIHFTYSGKVVLTPVGVDPTTREPIFTARWTVPFIVRGGTGRFLKVSGRLDTIADNAPFKLSDGAWPFSWTQTGSMTSVGRSR